MKKTFSLLLMILLCLSFLACAASPALTAPTADDAAPSSSATQPTDAASPVQFPLKEEFTLHINYDTAAPEGVDMQKALEANALYQELYQLTNVKVQIHFYGREHLNSMIQTVNNPGIFIINNNQDQLIANGDVMPLDAYIDNPALMPNLNQQVFANLPELRGTWAASDGHIYALGEYDSDPTGTVENYLWINKTWLDRANMEVPTTFEELEAALTYFAEHDMNGNAVSDDEIPFHTDSSYDMKVEGLLGMWGIPIGASAIPSSGHFLRLMYIDNGTAQFADNDQVKQFITTMKRWYDSGILCESFDASEPSTTDAILSDTHEGAVLAGAFLAPNLDGIRGREEYVCILPPAADGNSVRWFRKSNAFGTPGMLCLSKDCENPEIIMAWLDQFYGLDTTIRYCYGEDSSIGRVTNADGTFSPLQSDETAKNEAMYTKQNLLIDILPDLPYAKTQDFYDKYQRSAEENEQLQNWNLYKDILHPEPMPHMAYSEDDIAEFMDVNADIDTLFLRFRGLAITGQEDLESIWGSYQKELQRMTINHYLSIVQNRYDAWLSEKAG